MVDDIRVGVIGFGMAGKIFHTAVVEATPGLELAAIVQRKGDEAAKAYPRVKIARSIEELLEDESIRLVVVATPSPAHFENAAQCLRAGRNVVVDKPFTLTSDEARKLIELAREQRVLVTAYQNRRWDGDFVTLKQVIDSGELGRLVCYESHFDRYRAEPKLDVWRENGGPGGGTLFDLGPHLIDQTTTLFGDPASLYADVRVERAGAVVDDAWDVLMKFSSGVTALLRSTLTAYTPGPRFVVHGTKGSFVKWGLDPQEDALKAGGSYSDPGFGEEPVSQWGELRVVGKPPRRVETAAGDYRGLYANVRDAILGVAELEVKPEQVWRTTRLIELCCESSQEGRRIEYKA
ncbi:MAG TPA: Gfo/Idh/MocA family oxidoreductase [Silvibacterium sp.]|jgi:predicted dehydrogenase|nr:Gfo/Idh/MocA family oxidoreductase [Silvibacterium sp.]